MRMKIKNKTLLLAVCLSLVACGEEPSVSNKENESSNIEESSSLKESSTVKESSSPFESTIPNISTPEASTPEVSVPSTSTPDVSVPSTSTPEVSTPDVSVPGASTPEASTPDISVPSTSTPEVSSPSISDGPIVDGELNVTLHGYSFESAYFQWEQYSNATSYNVYCDNKLIDSQLIRKYPTYYRVDIVGLSAKEHIIDIVPVYNTTEILQAKETYKVTPMAHVREGFAFVNGTSNGAYNGDGTLKDNALVFYVDNNNKDSIKATITSSSKGATTECVGVQNILNVVKKGYETRPINFRFIGNITDLATMEGGDLLIDTNKTSYGITFEGIGTDTTFNGFGLRIKNAANIEVRNIGFMNCNSNEGDNVGLQQSNNHVWVHNCDFFYGDAGSDADQAKGDGALDTKTSAYVTHSFNHFFDTGKSNLQGMKNETTENYITYHHNYYDHSDSRHPRVRTCSVHTYNNYFTGIAKYGIGATMGSSIFVENNYFENTNNPMLSSLQGTDALGDGTFSGENGGLIKSYGNRYVGTTSTPITYQKNNTSFDCYEATSRNEIIPNTVKTLVGGTTYNNFDTSSIMYSYNVEIAIQAKETTMSYAGRVQGGDFKWTFTDADNSDYNVNQNLKKALSSYVGYIPTYLTSNPANPDNNEENQDSSGSNNESPLPDDSDSSTPSLPTSNLALTFASLNSESFTSNIVIDSVYSLLAAADKKMTIANETVTVNGVTYTKVLKLEGKGNTTYRSIKIKLEAGATIKVVAKNNSTSERKLGLLDAEGNEIQSFAAPTGGANTLTYTVSKAGTYYITSLNSGINVYGIIIEYN